MIGTILGGIGGLIGTVANTIFSGLNYASEKEKNKRNIAYHEGQSSRVRIKMFYKNHNY